MYILATKRKSNHQIKKNQCNQHTSTASAATTAKLPPVHHHHFPLHTSHYQRSIVYNFMINSPTSHSFFITPLFFSTPILCTIGGGGRSIVLLQESTKKIKYKMEVFGDKFLPMANSIANSFITFLFSSFGKVAFITGHTNSWIIGFLRIQRNWTALLFL